MDKFKSNLERLVALGGFKNEGVVFSLAVYIDEHGKPDYSYLGLSYLGKVGVDEENKQVIVE